MLNESNKPLQKLKQLVNRNFKNKAFVVFLKQSDYSDKSDIQIYKSKT